MSEAIWAGYLDSISGEEKLLKLAMYEVEVTGARPFKKDDEVRRGIFVDLQVTKGPERNSTASVYIAIPEPGNKKQGFWYNKKMAGFGDLTAVYESMPDDLEGGLLVLCQAITGRKVLAQIGPGQGEFSNRNNLGETKPLGPAVVATVPTIDNADEAVEETVEIDADDPGF